MAAVKRFKLEYLPKKTMVATVEIPVDLVKAQLFWKTLVEQVLGTPIIDWTCINCELKHDLYMLASDPNDTQYIVEEKNTLAKRILEFYKVDGVSNNLKLSQI